MVSNPKTIRDFYNKMTDYDDFWFADRILYDQIHEVMLSNLPKHADMVLDVGCGTGIQSEILLNRGFRVVGVDIARNLLRIASNKTGRGLACFEASGTHLPFRSSSFELVICYYNVINHIPDYLLALQEIAKVLRSDGWLFLEVEKTSLIDTFLEVVDFFLGGRLGYFEDRNSILRHIIARSDHQVITWVEEGMTLSCWKFYPKKLEEELRQLGFSVIRKYGIRVFVSLVPWGLQIMRSRLIHAIMNVLNVIDKKTAGGRFFREHGLSTVYVLRKSSVRQSTHPSSSSP